MAFPSIRVAAMAGHHNKSAAAVARRMSPRSRSLRSMARELIDLHIHVGGAVAPHVLWSLAHSEGFKLPTKNYFEFVEMITARPDNVRNLDDYLRIMHTWTEKIQSSPMAIERSVYEVIGKEYRGSRVTQIELRFNPMKRNLDSTLDLDHIIHAALPGDGPGGAGVRGEGRPHLLPRPGVRPPPQLDHPGKGHQVPAPGSGGHRPGRHRDPGHRARRRRRWAPTRTSSPGPAPPG